MYYLCSHEQRYNTKDYWADYTVRPVRHSHAYIFTFLIRNRIVGSYPKSLSAMKRAGNNNAACR